MTTKETIAAALNGIEYRSTFPKQVVADAKAAGLLIISGASDDLMEFDGAFRDEVGAYEGTTVHLDRAGLIQRDEDATDNQIVDFAIRSRASRTVTAEWDNEDYAWTYATDIPHATFDIVDNGEKYCRAIVIALADLPEAQRLPPEASAS